jgi:hypothetical protein
MAAKPNPSGLPQAILSKRIKVFPLQVGNRWLEHALVSVLGEQELRDRI